MARLHFDTLRTNVDTCLNVAVMPGLAKICTILLNFSTALLKREHGCKTVCFVLPSIVFVQMLTVKLLASLASLTGSCVVFLSILEKHQGSVKIWLSHHFSRYWWWDNGPLSICGTWYLVLYFMDKWLHLNYLKIKSSLTWWNLKKILAAWLGVDKQPIQEYHSFSLLLIGWSPKSGANEDGEC